MRHLCLLAALLLSTGCSLILDPERCESQGDCLEGQVCAQGMCRGGAADGADADMLAPAADASLVPLVDAAADEDLRYSLRRLTRREYADSMKALVAYLGEDLLAQEEAFIDEVAASLPPDAVEKGMENLAERQSTSDIMVEAHWDAAQIIAQRLAEQLPPIESFVDCGEPAPRARIQSVQMERADGVPIDDEVRLLTSGMVFFDYSIPESGAYRLHMRAWGEQLALQGPDVIIEIDGQEVQRFDVNSLEPFTYESEPIVIEQGRQRLHIRYVNDDFVEGVGDINFFMQWLEIEGPIDQTVVDADARRRACLDQFIHWVALRAWRRPLSADGLILLRRIYQAGAADGGFHTGIEALLAGIFFSPRFLYVLDFADESAAEGGRLPLDGWSVAGRLAQSLWGSLPDDALLEAAASGALDTSEGVMDEARRMLQDPRAEARILNFFQRWLYLYEVPTLSRAEAIYEGNLDLFKSDILTETMTFIADVVWDQEGGYADLMRSTSSFLNIRLGRFYDATVVAASPNEFVPAALPSDQRMGILTHASLLSVTSKHVQTSPVDRGVFIQEQILCRELPPPPNFNTEVPELDEARTTRERWENMTSNQGASCANCHTLINPTGFLFERYDAVGRWRDDEFGLPIDDSGYVKGTAGLEDPFEGALILADTLAEHPDALSCMARQWFRYGMGRMERMEDPVDAATVAAMVEVLDGGHGSLLEMFIRLTGSEAFLTTAAPGQ